MVTSTAVFVAIAPSAILAESALVTTAAPQPRLPLVRLVTTQTIATESTVTAAMKLDDPRRRQVRDSVRATRSVRDSATPAVVRREPKGSLAVKFAYAQIGKPYYFGASGPSSYDCSGLTMAAWNSVGVRLPHNAAAQYRVMRHVSRAELVPGDLIFYFSGISHVGIYAGNGQMIDAPRPGKTIGLHGMNIMPIVGYGRPVSF